MASKVTLTFWSDLSWAELAKKLDSAQQDKQLVIPNVEISEYVINTQGGTTVTGSYPGTDGVNSID